MIDQSEHGLPDIAADVAWVRRLAVAVASDAHAAEELAQDAWLAASRSASESNGNLRAWLAGAVRKLQLHRLRSDAERVAREHEAARSEAVEDPALALERLETVELLSRAVRGLPEPYRATVLLRWYEGLLPEEIARTTETPVRTVHSRLNRALALLRAELDRRTRGDRAAWLAAWIPILPKSASVTPWVLVMGLKFKIALAAGLAIALLSLGFFFGPLKGLFGSPVASPALVRAEPQESVHEESPRPPSLDSGGETRQALGAEPVALTSPLAVPRSLLVRVRNAQGHPIAGVDLNTLRFGTRGTTGPDGTFVVPYSTRLDLLHVFPCVAEKDGYSACAVPLPAVRVSVLEIELTVPPAPNVLVTVLDDAQVPHPGACVVLTSGAPPAPMPSADFEGQARANARLSLLGMTRGERIYSATTDASGSASFSIPAGNYALVASAPRHLRHQGTLRAGKSANAPVHVTVAFPAGRELRGRVIDARTGQPIAAARVWHPGSGCDLVVTDERGEFQALVPDAPEVQKVRVYHPDYVPLITEQSGSMDFELDPGIVARLRFIDAAQRPITGPIRMEGFPPQNLYNTDVHWAYFRTVVADSEGNVDVRGIKPDLLATLYFGVDDYVRATLPVDAQAALFTGGRTVVTLTAKSLCRVALVDSSGSPVEGAEVTFTTQAAVAGVDTRTSPGELVEDEPGVYLLPSYLASLDSRIEVTAVVGNQFAVQVIKEPGVPLPSTAKITLPGK